MRRSLSLLYVLSLGSQLVAAPPLGVQEVKLSLQEMEYEMRSHKTEIDLLLERIQKLEEHVLDLSALLNKNSRSRSLEGKVAELERAHNTLVGDFKMLKKHLDETSSSIASCEKRLHHIDRELTHDIRSLKTSLASMLSMLQQEGERSYTVQSGDSLGQIAMDHKTTIKVLKEMNNLSNDTIRVGQKLRLP